MSFFLIFKGPSKANTADSENLDEVQHWNDRLQGIFEKLSTNFLKRPDIYLPGIKQLVKTLEKKFQETSDNGIVSSLFSMKNSLLRTGNKIRTQPTGKARRKKPEERVRVSTHLAGRKCLQSGRPPKSARVSEHGYNKSMQPNVGHMHPIPCKKTRHIAPHSLSARVDALRK